MCGDELLTNLAGNSRAKPSQCGCILTLSRVAVIHLPFTDGDNCGPKGPGEGWPFQKTRGDHDRRTKNGRQQAFDACLKLVHRAAKEAERLATGLGGRFLSGVRLADLRMHLSQAAETIAATRPSHRCGGCNGAGCQRCEHAGWLCSEEQRLDGSV